jgi:hypothetical protein
VYGRKAKRFENRPGLSPKSAHSLRMVPQQTAIVDSHRSLI